MTSVEPNIIADPLPNEVEEEEEQLAAPLSPKTAETPETVVVVSPPSSPTLDFDDLVQQIEPLEGIDPLSDIDPLAWDLGDSDNESLVLDDDELAALWDIGEDNLEEEPRQSPAAPTEEEVPETKSAAVENDPKTTDPKEIDPKEVVAEETKTGKTQEEKEKNEGEANKEESSDQQPNDGEADQQQDDEEVAEGTDGLPSYLYCQPISPSANEAETSPSQLLQAFSQDDQGPQLSREQLLDEVAGLDLGSLAQLALSMDELKGSAQDELLNILEEATGIKETDQDLFDLEGDDLFEELKELGFGGLADIAREASNEPAPICQPCTPSSIPIISTSSTQEDKESKPAEEESNLGNIDNMPKRDLDGAPRIVELTGDDDKTGKPKARNSDSRSNPDEKPRPITPGPGDDDQPKVDKEKEAVPAESPTQEKLQNGENQKTKSQRQGSPSKNDAFLARLLEYQAEAKRKEEEEIKNRPPLDVTDVFKGCMPCAPRQFLLIRTKKPAVTQSGTTTQESTQTQSEKKENLQQSKDGDNTITKPKPKPKHPQQQKESTDASNDASDSPPQSSQSQQQEEQQQDNGDNGDNGAPGDYNPARPEAWDLAGGLLKTFGLVEGSKKKEQSCFGHKEKIFGVSFSECGNFCASASQDASINIWDVKKNTLLASLKGHSRDYECLRVVWASSTWSSDSLDRTSNFQYLLASSGADGTVRFWACKDPRIKQGREGSWKCCLTFDHMDLRTKKSEVGTKLGSITEDEEKEEDKGDDKDKPQVYSLQYIDHWQAFNNKMGEKSKNAFFMTSSDDHVHFWEIDIRSGMEQILTMGEDQEISLKLRPDEMGLKEVFSLHFGNMNQFYYGVEIVNVTEQGLQVGGTETTDKNSASTGNKFGGERNPDNIVYVFDASYCPANGLLGVALSDGSLRLHNGRGHCVSVMNLPGMNSHLTSFAWDRSGERLATTVATGHLITWHVHMGDVQGNGNAKAECMAIMEGGHQPGRPLFGAKYLGGEHEHLILSWGIDGSLCLWDSYLQGNVNVPIAALRQDDKYPIYAVDVHHEQKVVAVAGGTDGGFIGTPLYLYNYKEANQEEGKASE